MTAQTNVLTTEKPRCRYGYDAQHRELSFTAAACVYLGYYLDTRKICAQAYVVAILPEIFRRDPHRTASIRVI